MGYIETPDEREEVIHAGMVMLYSTCTPGVIPELYIQECLAPHAIYYNLIYDMTVIQGRRQWYGR